MAEPEAADQKSKPKKGARASLQVEGEVDPETVEDVLHAAGKGNREPLPPALKTARFPKAIRDLTNHIIATRTYPQTLNDGTPLGDEYEIRPHEELTEKEIIDELTRARGGERWHCRVEDGEGNMVAAKPLRVGGEPRLDPMLETLGGGELPRGRRGGPMAMGEEVAFGEEETVEERLAKDPEIIKAKKAIELQKLEAELAEARAKRAQAERALNAAKDDGKPAPAPPADDIDRKLAAAVEAATKPLRDENERLRRRDEERDRKAEDQARLDAATKPLQDAIASQRTAIEQILNKLNAPPPPAPQGPSLADQLANLRRDWKEDMQQYVTSALTGITSKLETLASSVNLIAASKGNDAAVNALTAIATAKGTGGAPADPFQTMNSMLAVMKNLQTLTGPTGPSDFGSLVVEKLSEMTPEVLGFIKDQSQKAEGVTKEGLEAKLREVAGKMYNALDATLKQEINRLYQSMNALQQQGRIAGPVTAPGQAPAPVAAPAQPPIPGAASVQAGQSAAPQPVAAPGVQPIPTAPTPAPAPAQPTVPAAPGGWPPQLTPQESAEYQKRINWVLQGMLAEFRVGAQNMQWPKKAYENLPRAVVNEIVYNCTEDVHLHNIVKPFADQALLDQVWQFISETNKDSDWYMDRLIDGINWIKRASGVVVEEAPTQ